MPDVTSDHFFSLLHQSNLLTNEQLESVRADFAIASDDQQPQLIEQLIEHGWLTHWQAKMLLAGRHAFFLGKYKLLDHLGQGGMGSVFKAEQMPLGRLVAIKTVRKDLVGRKQLAARFHREIQAVAALNHPNIVAAYDADSVAGHHFLVMEYVEGRDLGVLIKGGKKLPIGTACEYVRQAALGLQHAHEQQMVHRDIKPSNLLLKVESQESRDKSKTFGSSLSTGDSRPVVKILDMGLARIVHTADSEQTELTHTGQVVGTPDYISPEQALDTKTADVRSDIYSLGCTLYRLLTGKVPFQGDGAIAKITARLTDDPPALRSMLPDAPTELEAVLLKMMARDVEDRYQTPIEVVQALAPFADVTAAPPNSPEASAAATRGDAPTVTAVIAPELYDFLNQLGIAAARDEEIDTDTQEFERTEAVGPRQPVDQSTPTIAFDPVTDVADQPRRSPQISRAGQKLKAEIADRNRADRRRWLIILSVVVLFIAVVVGFQQWQRAGETTLVIDWPLNERQESMIEVDGRKVTLTKEQRLPFNGAPGKRQLHLTRDGYKTIKQEWDLTRGQVIEFIPDWKPNADTIRKRQLAALAKRVEAAQKPGILKTPSFSDPVVTKLRSALVNFHRKHSNTPEAINAAKEMSRLSWPVDNLRRDQIDPYELKIAGHGDPENAPAELVAVLGDSRLKHWGAVSSVAFSPDGKTIVSCGGDCVVRLWDRMTGKQIRQLNGHTREVRSVAFSPNRRVIASGSTDSSLKLWNAESGEELHTMQPASGWIESVAFNTDGSRIVTGSSLGTVTIWDVLNGEEVQTFEQHPNQVLSVDYSLDGSQVASICYDGLIRLWDVKTGRQLRTLETRKKLSSNSSVAFSPDGKLLAIPAIASHGIHLYDYSTGELRQTLANGGSSMSFSPDGTLLATALSPSVIIWNVQTGEIVHRLDGSALGGIRSTVFSPDGKMLAAAAGHDDSVMLWSLSEDVLIELTGRHSKNIRAVDVSPDGTTICSASLDATLGLWNAATGELRQTIHNLDDGNAKSFHPFNSVQYNSAGTRIFAGALFSSYLLDAQTGEQVFSIPKDNPPLSWVVAAITPNGKTVSFAGDKGFLGFWDTATGDIGKLFQTNGNGILSIACRPDGKQLATGNRDGSVSLWKLSGGKLHHTMRAYQAETRCVAYSPNGRLLATCGNSYNDEVGVQLWDSQTGRKRNLLEGHTGTIYSIDFSPDGRVIASASLDGTVRLTEVTSGKLLQSIRLLVGGTINEVAFTPDGRHLVTANGNGTVYVLRLKEWAGMGNE